MYSQPYYIKFQETNWNNVSSHFTDSHTRDLDKTGEEEEEEREEEEVGARAYGEVP